MNETSPQIPQYDDEIQLIDLLRVIWKWKLFIILMVILCSLASMGYIVVKYPAKNVTECIIELNFSGIENHKNPDGTRFDKDQIITPNILHKAITSSKILEYKENQLKDIRGLINIKSIIQPGVEEKRKEETEEEFAFFPNRFKLSLTTTKKDFFTMDKRTQLLLSIVDEYRKNFNRKYGEEPLLVVDFPDNFSEKYDYIEIVQIFSLRLDNLINVLDSKLKKAGFFRSKKTGLTFADIKLNVQLINEIELSNAEAVIRETKLTKDKDNLISKYKSQIRKTELQRRKKKSEELVAKKLLKEMRQPDRYEVSGEKDKGEASIVMDSSFIQNLRENDYYSFLLKTAMDAGINAGNLAAEKQYLEEEIESLLQKEKDNKKKYSAIQNSLIKVQKDIVLLSKQTNELNQEYLQYVIDDAIQIIKHPETNVIRSRQYLKIAFFSGVVALFLSLFSAFFLEYVKNIKNKMKTR